MSNSLTSKMASLLYISSPTTAKCRLPLAKQLMFKGLFQGMHQIIYPYMPATLLAINKIWAETYPDYPFEYQFLSDKIASFYKQENSFLNYFNYLRALLSY